MSVRNYQEIAVLSVNVQRGAERVCLLLEYSECDDQLYVSPTFAALSPFGFVATMFLSTPSKVQSKFATGG